MEKGVKMIRKITGPITALCHKPTGPGGTFDIRAIVAAIETANMDDDSQFHDMMHGLYWDPAEDIDAPGLLASSNQCLMSIQGLGETVVVPDGNIERWARGLSAPERSERKSAIRNKVLEALSSLV